VGTHVQVIFWVLGEYGTLAPIPAADVMGRMCATADTHSFGDATKGFLLAAVGKLAAQARMPITPAAEELLHASQSSHNIDLQQRALEVQALLECVPGQTPQLSLSSTFVSWF
jgi:hypothetical protein